MRGGGGSGDGLLEGGDVAQQVLLLARQVLDAGAQPRVKGRVDDLGLRGAPGRRVVVGGEDRQVGGYVVDGQAVDGQVRPREGEYFGYVLEEEGAGHE